MDDEPRRLGIRPVREYSPAAPVQGPFLPLLRKHESEGLRLIHGLVNAATTRWRESERRGRSIQDPRTALPLRLLFPDGEQTFWGNDLIYCWYRGTTAGPEAVVSALMALEFWVEEQLTTDRDASELFSTVLEGSESVAVLAVIVSAALARLGAGLDVLAPLVGDARIWVMDEIRVGHDLQGTFILDFLGRDREINELLSQRNRLPQRQLRIRELLPLYLFDENWKERLEEWRQTFGKPLPFQFEEELNDPGAAELREWDVKEYRTFFDRENYRVTSDTEGRVFIQYCTPGEILSQNQRGREEWNRRVAPLSIKNWARRSIEQRSLADGRDASEAIRTAQSLLESEGLEKPDSAVSIPLDWIRIEAIAEVAAAVLIASSRPTLSADESDWLRSVLIAAARAPRVGHVIQESYHPSDPKVSAALGLSALAGLEKNDQEVRESLLFLAWDAQHQVVAAVIQGLCDAWSQDPALCWNCLSLAVASCCIPKSVVMPFERSTSADAEQKWAKSVWETHLGQLRDGIIPDLPKIELGKQTFLEYGRMAGILGSLPFIAIEDDPSGKQRLIHLLDDLMTRTLAPAEKERDDGFAHVERDLVWEGKFFGWSARMTRMMTPEEEETHITRPLLATWPGRPKILESFLFGYLLQQLGGQASLREQAVVTWERVWDILLNSPEFRSRALASDSYSREDELETLAVFVSHGLYVCGANWPHAPRFATIIDRWVKVAGTTHIGCHALITMLKQNVERFEPTIILGWLQHSLTFSKDVRGMLRAYNNGTRMVELLSLLHSQRQELLDREGLMPTLASIVDALVGGGTSAAGLLRQRVEDGR